MFLLLYVFVAKTCKTSNTKCDAFFISPSCSLQYCPDLSYELWTCSGTLIFCMFFTFLLKFKKHVFMSFIRKLMFLSIYTKHHVFT